MTPDALTSLPLVQRITAWDPACISDGHNQKGELTLVTSGARWVALAEFLKRDGFDQCADVTCVDWVPADPRFEIVCHLYNVKRKEWVRIKTWCGEDNPPPTLIPVWPAANWFEREVFDLFGVRFAGHPNLTRMLMPDEWKGHPLRKDYPVEGYR